MKAAISVPLEMTILPLSISTHRLLKEFVDWDGCGSDDRDTSNADRRPWPSRACVLANVILSVIVVEYQRRKFLSAPGKVYHQGQVTNKMFDSIVNLLGKGNDFAVLRYTYSAKLRHSPPKTEHNVFETALWSRLGHVLLRKHESFLAIVVPGSLLLLVVMCIMFEALQAR